MCTDFFRDGRRFHRPLGKPNIPFLLRDILVTVIGPSNEARFRPRNVRLSDRIKSPFRQQAALPPHTIATGVPGKYTVGDVANRYDINPAITAAGGTTTPVSLKFSILPNAPALVVSTEQVWGRDYLQNYLVDNGAVQYQNALFPVGSGGGVSVFWPVPAY